MSLPGSNQSQYKDSIDSIEVALNSVVDNYDDNLSTTGYKLTDQHQRQHQQQPLSAIPPSPPLTKGTMLLESKLSLDESNKATSRIRAFKQMNNLKMSTHNINQVLPVECAKEFQVVWRNLSYKLRALERTGYFNRLTEKQILNNLNGQFSSGQVTAIMGPSGAGKSTLLEILACRRNKGITGEIKVKNKSKLRIAYVPQDNYLDNSLTVNETMLFASRLHNIRQPNYDHKAKVDKLIHMFGLELIRGTFIKRCSGGQQKRLSIAVELFANPNVLILDEPTTGLDSSSCSLVMKLLKELVDNPNPMAIVTTIHQPSWNVFSEIDHVYIIAKKGECLYAGSPNKLLPLLSKLDLACDPYNSPSDYIIEIAAEDYGREPIKKLQEHLDSSHSDADAEELSILPTMREARIIRKVPFWSSLWILLHRSGLRYIRHMLLNILRIISITCITIWLQTMFGSNIGKVSGCALRKYQLWNTPIDALSTMFEENILQATQNCCCLFFGLMIGLISGLTSVVLDFPRDMHILMKEYNNGWYSCLAFYITKSLMDIPMQMILPSIYVLYIYEFTNQPKQMYRKAYLWFITILVTFTSESIGAICSVIFMANPATAAFVAGAIPLPMTLFGGFLVKYSRMPVYMQAVSWLSMLKYAFEALMVTIYGFDRCEYNYNEFLSDVNVSAIEKPIWAKYLPMVMSTLFPNANDDNKSDSLITNGNNTIVKDEDQEVIDRIYTISFQSLNQNNAHKFDPNRSLILSYYELHNDDVLYISVAAMVAYLIFFKIITYYIILARLNY